MAALSQAYATTLTKEPHARMVGPNKPAHQLSTPASRRSRLRAGRRRCFKQDDTMYLRAAPETAIHARGHPRATVPDEPPLQWSSSRDVSVLGRALIYVPAAAAHLLLLAVAGRAEVLAALLAAPLEHRTPRRRGHARAEARGVRALALRATLGAAQREAAGDHHQRAASALHGGHRARRQRQAYRGGWR